MDKEIKYDKFRIRYWSDNRTIAGRFFSLLMNIGLFYVTRRYNQSPRAGYNLEILCQELRELLKKSIGTADSVEVTIKAIKSKEKSKFTNNNELSKFFNGVKSNHEN